MFEDSVKDWITNFLSKQSPAFNDLPPCPFAKQALIDNKIVSPKPPEDINKRPDGGLDRFFL